MSKVIPTCESCKSGCKYISSVRGTKTCNYILIENEPRGCDPGANCTKYTKGKRIRLNDGMFW